jgi:hypothetical protein
MKSVAMGHSTVKIKNVSAAYLLQTKPCFHWACKEVTPNRLGAYPAAPLTPGRKRLIKLKITKKRR